MYDAAVRALAAAEKPFVEGPVPVTSGALGTGVRFIRVYKLW